MRADEATSAPHTTAKARGQKAARAVAPAAIDPEILRKPVNTLAIIPKSARITSLGRKAYNVLLFEAQEQGLERDVYRAPLEKIIKGVDFDSNDHALIKKHLRAMVSTTVEWQSPTTGEGGSWNVSGLLAHAKLYKDRGQVWVEWSYAVNLKQELLEPTVFARLKLEIISQLRSHAGIALYEICTRYKDVGRTSRQHWRWWRPVLSGQPETEKNAKLEYRIFKRDTLKPAIAEVSAITDLDIQLIEHKEGRFIADIQFLIQPKKQPSLPLTHPPEPVDLAVVADGTRLGIAEDKVEELVGEFGEDAVRSGLASLERRIASAYPEPLRDHYRYLKSLMPGEAAKAQRRADESTEATKREALQLPNKRQTRWAEEWMRRRREQLIAEMRALPMQQQGRLAEELLRDMESRQVHPSICKRLVNSGWEHPMVVHEMVKHLAVGRYGEGWDRPTPEQLLQIAVELGDA